MPTIAMAVLVAVLAVACAGSDRPGWPTAPSAVGTTTSPRAGIREEQWRLELTIREVFGAECDPSVTSSTRVVDLEMAFADDGMVAMRYAQPAFPNDDATEVAGWSLDGGFEGSGRAYEGLPCSGRALEPGGAPTTLTGYFSDDGRRFSGVEVRRYIGRATGDIVYHVEWNASRVDN